MPRGIVWLAGAAEIVKSPTGGGTTAFTTNVTVVECVIAPLTPEMVSVYVPAGVVLAVVTVSVEDPESVTVGGLKLTPASWGKPLTLRLTVPPVARRLDGWT